MMWWNVLQCWMLVTTSRWPKSCRVVANYSYILARVTVSLNALLRLPVPKICHIVACLRFRGSTLSRAQLWRAFCDAGRSSCRIFPVSVHAQLRMSLFFARFFFKKTPGSTRGYKRQFCGISPVVWEI